VPPQPWAAGGARGGRAVGGDAVMKTTSGVMSSPYIFSVDGVYRSLSGGRRRHGGWLAAAP
jgi:hypothetical protein